MIHNLKCETCNKKFESKRATTKYCSNSCKQKAHYQRIAEKDEAPPHQETHANIFYLDEFKMVDWHIAFVSYCFFRRHLSLNATTKEIDKYLASTYIEYDYFEDLIKPTKAFKEFNERFLNNEFKVFPNRFVDGKDIYGAQILS